MKTDLKAKVEACYRRNTSLDNHRHHMGRLYLDGAQGREIIVRCFVELPSSNHQLSTLDSQSILDAENNEGIIESDFYRLQKPL